MEIEAARHKPKAPGRGPNLDNYMDFNEIQQYLQDVVNDFPGIARVINIGSSSEGRRLTILHLSTGPGKPGLIIDATIHAREWIAPSVATYVISQLTDNLAENQKILDANDIYVMPVVNPDGYEYSWTDDRMWRKTRSLNQGTPCIGTDGNRNYDWHWAGDGIPPACSETYPGDRPFSEPETAALEKFFIATPNITSYLTLHSYGQYVLYPWGDTANPPPNVKELSRVGHAVADAIEAVAGTRYTVGSIFNVLYAAYGGSLDWILGNQRIMQEFGFELPGGGSLGFNPPSSSIRPICEETWEGIKVIMANIPATRG